jgi:hypothetical protein
MIETRYDPAADVLHVTFGAAGAAYDNTKEVALGRMSRSTRKATRWAWTSPARGGCPLGAPAYML